MRKAMILLISSALIFSSVGCGTDTSATSDSSSATTEEVVAENLTDTAEVDEPTATEENEKLNNESSNDETEIQESNQIATSGTDTKGPVDWKDYLDGETWNLTAYAKALGYEWIPDLEREGVAMYKIVHNGNNYFCCYYSGRIYVLYGGSDGEPWYVSPMGTQRGSGITVISDGQEELKVHLESIEKIASVFECLAKPDADLSMLPIECYTVVHNEGVAEYYDNGLIKYQNFGKPVEVIDYRN